MAKVYGGVNGYDGRPTAAQIDQVKVLGDQLDKAEARLAAVQGGEVAAVNRELEKRKLEPIKAKTREEWEKQDGQRATALPAFLPFTVLIQVRKENGREPFGFPPVSFWINSWTPIQGCADWGLSQALTTLFQQLAHDLLAGLHGLALALHRGLLEVLPLTQLGQDSRFLDFALESAQRVLEALLLAHMHNGHRHSPLFVYG